MNRGIVILLAIAGAVSSHPQYTGPAASDLHQVGESEGILGLFEAVETPFDREQTQALKEFWWKAQGVFNKQPQHSNTGAHVPADAALCDVGFDCVDWRRCVDGYIAESNTLTAKPTNFAALQCGQADHMCCGLPSDILGLLEPVIDDVLPHSPEVLPVGGSVNDGYTQPAGVSPPIHSGCGHISYDCVPYFQCIDGVINTDGEGLIDVRVRPQGQCSNPEYPDVPAVCCLKPDAYATPEPIEKCPGYQQCVDFSLCSADGTINIDGSGLIDIRTGYTSCWLPTNIGGICCTPPAPHVDLCPGNSVCLAGHQCTGQALDGLSNFIDYTQTGLWSQCSYGNEKGVCCIPKVLDTCPGDSLCVDSSTCIGQGLNHLGQFVDYASSGSSHWSQCAYGNGKGVCCVPKILDTCPGDSLCLESSSCIGQGLNHIGEFVDYTPQGSWSHCSAYDKGVCCKTPKINYRAADECGIRNYAIDERITSNYEPNEASFGEFPWQAILFYQNYTFIGGASLISDRHVLTGAHLVYDRLPEDIRIRFGEWQVNDFNEPLAYVDKNVKHIYYHDDFNPKNLHNDIAVLELYEPLSFQYHINSVCLPDYGRTFDPNYPCFATGWGKDAFTGNYQHILKKIDLPYVHHPACQNLLRNTRLGKYFKLDDSFVCAGGLENKDACYGDGGGPLICKDPATSQYLQVGITAWGIGCGTKDVPGVYVDVQAFKNWIDDIVYGKGNTGEKVPIPGYGK